jgi:hypothetical protein
MDGPRRLVTVVSTLLTLFLLLPGAASADCNGPTCEPIPAVEWSTIAATLVTVAIFVAVLALADVRRR